MSAALRCTCTAAVVLNEREVAPGLPAWHCAGCDSELLWLDQYRSWCATAPAAPPADNDEAPLVLFETASARACPACSRLMQRRRSGTDPEFRIDRCVACQCVWLDAGEWDLLEREGLRHRLVELLADGWQREAQANELRAERESALRGRLGDACVDELMRIRAWLATQPNRDELIGLLGADW